VIYRQTQTAQYWNEFTVRPDDAEFIYGSFLEEGRPQRVKELARRLILQRIESENAALRRQLSGAGKTYQPKNQYAVGEEITFPILGFVAGVVRSVRPASTNEVDPFDVMSVALADGSVHEFAASYKAPHKLNDLDISTLVDDANLRPAEELVEMHLERVSTALSAALEKNPELIRIGDEWFLRAMMAEVNIGHLNLAEAVLDMAAGHPLTTDVILRDLGLPEDVAANVQEASLNNALGHDDRFDEVSLTDKPAWVLRRSTPVESRERPAVLTPASFGSMVTLSAEIETLIEQIGDEIDFPHPLASPPPAADSAQVVLTYPHRLAGTLGWTRPLSAVLPMNDKPRVPLSFRDRSSGKSFVVWLVRDGGYLWGLADFYRSSELPAGAEVTISRTSSPQEYLIDVKRRKPKREWVRVASVQGNHLRLETAQRAVSCEFDDQTSVFVDDARALDALRAVRDLAGAVRESFLEIAKLSPQGNVHLRTLYAVVNTLVRAGARDVFSALVANGSYVPVGDNYWHLGER
jgi:hypothetical protein